MPDHINIVAQNSMDLYYTNYKSNSDFFDIEDFIAHCAGVLGDYYWKMYQQIRAENRQDKKEEVITFDPGILIVQDLEVKQVETALFATLPNGVMSFPYDEQGTGVQRVFSPTNKCLRFERTSYAAVYQLEYIPVCDVIWWYVVKNEVHFVNKTSHNISNLKAFTVPSISDPNLMVPDAIREYIVTTGAMTIKEGGKNAVVKKSIDQNPNKLIQTEANLSDIK